MKETAPTEVEQSMGTILRPLLLMSQRIQSFFSDEEVQRELRLVVEKLGRFQQAMELWDFVERASRQSHFLPHRSVPFLEFYRECRGNYLLFYSRVSNYYEDHEQDILQNIQSQLATLNVGEDPKATLLEAIQAHRYGLFRLSCRGLFPDIERVIIEDWLGKEELKSLSGKKLQEAIDKKKLEDFAVDSWLDMRLFGLLINHVYENDAHLKKIPSETLPNRHAALHAWLAYSSKENSLNTIIFAEYVFRLGATFREEKNGGSQ